MRKDSATVLLAMGYVIDRDFVAHGLDDGTTRVDWLSEQPMPAETDIDAYDLTAYNAEQAAIVTDKSDIKALAVQAVDDINTYLTIADSATNVQVRAEVKAIDIRQRAIIKALRRLV